MKFMEPIYPLKTMLLPKHLPAIIVKMLSMDRPLRTTLTEAKLKTIRHKQ